MIVVMIHNPAKIKEELGDLLFQIIFHAQIGKERGEFDMDAVVKTIAEKMIARHPHVFGDERFSTLEEVVEIYAKGGHPNPHLSKDIKKLDLTDQDKKDLVAFMEACTGEFPEVERGRLP